MCSILQRANHPERSGWRPSLCVQSLLLSLVFGATFLIDEKYMDIEDLMAKQKQHKKSLNKAAQAGDLE